MISCAVMQGVCAALFHAHLEATHTLPRSRHFAANGEHWCVVSHSCGERGRHVKNARSADFEADAKTA
jgi:hypothetical protein